MENLWKSSNSEAGLQYVDLFERIENGKFASDTKYTLLNSPLSKSNEQAIELRNRGNEQFYLKNVHKAMDCYNQSVCFAEIDSENVALAYANRSVCFFHMKKYRECCFDIELAKNAAIPRHMLAELDQRKQECHDLMATGGQRSEHWPKLSYEPDKDFPCVANVLELKHNNEFGRHFTAKCDIPVGKIVLEEQSFIGTRKNNDSMSCATCLQLGMNFIACPYCTAAVFCTQKCMDQNVTHKWECGTLFNSFEHEIRFQAQAIFLAIEAFANVDQLMQFVLNILINLKSVPTTLHDAVSKYHFFFRLSTSTPATDDIYLVYKIYTDLMCIHKIATLFDTQAKQQFLKHLVAHHFLVILNNAHGSKAYESVGNMFSMFNHSCTPNVLQYFAGKQYLIIIRPVKSGDQLFISYLGTQKQSMQQRQEKLTSNWNFCCKCERCHPTGVAIDQKVITSDANFKFIFKNGYMEEKSNSILENSCNFLNKYGHSPWSEEIQFVINIYCAHLMRNNLNQLCNC